MSAPAAEIVIVREAELVSPRQSGRRLRAVCHLHGGDHQRSLSIETDGEAAGYGWCHSCHARVFVPELNPEAATRRERGDWRGPQTRQRITPASLLRPPRMAARAATATTPAPWQRAELELLASLDERMRARLGDERPRAYLAARGISYEMAAAAGIGYIPMDAPAKVRGVDIGKWHDRLIFPLCSPAGRGYAGRALWGWRAGMDENAHKALLEGTEGAPRRWEKTYPAGWMILGDLEGAQLAVVVEGPVDALALLQSELFDLADAPIVALVGTAGRPEWLLDQRELRGVVLALDGDARGSEAARNWRHELELSGLAARLCVPPASDGRGKDWAERWRLTEHEGVWPVAEALDTLPSPVGDRGAARSPAPASASNEDVVAEIPAEDFAALAAEAGQDAIVLELQAGGLILVDVQPVGATLPPLPAHLLPLPMPPAAERRSTSGGYRLASPEYAPGNCPGHEYELLCGLDGRRWCIHCHSPREAEEAEAA